MKLQSLPTFLVRRKNWLLMAALALSLTAALLLRPSSPQAQRVMLPMTSAESSASPLEAFRISSWLSTKKNRYRPKYSSAGFWSIRPSVRACILMRDDNITPPTQMASTV